MRIKKTHQVKLWNGKNVVEVIKCENLDQADKVWNEHYKSYSGRLSKHRKATISKIVTSKK